MPLITIAIPVYNRAHMVEDSILSVLRQKPEDFELIIVDNCSTDGTYDVARKYESEHVRVYRNDVNIGMGRNFLRCIELATGTFFRFLMSDDALLEGSLALTKTLNDLYPDVNIHFSAGINDVAHLGPALTNEQIHSAVQPAKQYNLDQARWMFHPFAANPNSYCIRTSMMKAMIKDPTFLALFMPLAATGHCIDYLMLVYNAQKSTQIAFIDEPTYRVRIHANQGSASYKTNLVLHLTGDYAVVATVYSTNFFAQCSFYRHACKTFKAALCYVWQTDRYALPGMFVKFVRAMLHVSCCFLGIRPVSVVLR